jgi:hypothetical protein
MAARTGSSGDDGIKNKRIAKAVAQKTAEKNAKQVKVVDLPITGKAARAKSKSSAKEAPKIVAKSSTKASEKRRSVNARRKAAAVQEEPVVTTIPTQEESEHMIKTFQKSLSVQAKSRPAKPKVSYTNFLAKPLNAGKKYTIDMRIHTPGTVGYFTSGGVEPGPALIRLAKVKGLDMVGLTDYYNASFVDVIQKSVDASKLSIVPGLDLCCAVGNCRDVHITALFPETYTSHEIFKVLTELQVPREMYGRSDYCMEQPFSEILAIVERNGGVVIPTQLDKTPYRQLAIPTLVNEFGIHAFDLVHPEQTDFFKDRWPDGRFTFFTFSNSSALAQIGTRSARVKLAAPTFAGIAEIVQRRLAS